MNRRNFLRSLVGGVATAAAVRMFPFRVFSFPTEIVTPQIHISEVALWDQLTTTTLAELREDILYDNFFVGSAWLKQLRRASLAIGSSEIRNSLA